jgi:acyl-CoA thioester hydrolase
MNSHLHTVTVAEGDIDALHHVNNVVYLQYCQDAATAHWQRVASAALQETMVWVVRRHEIEYLKQAVLGDVLHIKTWTGDYTAATWDRHYEIYRAADQQLLVKAKSVWVPIDRATMRVKRVDDAIKGCFLAL